MKGREKGDLCYRVANKKGTASPLESTTLRHGDRREPGTGASPRSHPHFFRPVGDSHHVGFVRGKTMTRS